MTEQAPHDCPGTESKEAGFASACAGCPNQSTCQTAPKGPDPDLAVITQSLKNVKHIIVVLSGKGGVGKSTFTAQLAHSLALQDLEVGVLDVDVCGPSIPRIMGVEGEQIRKSSVGWTPVYNDSIGIVSVGFMVPNPDDAIIWRGPKKNGLIKQFLRDVDWGELDYLIIDTPPGTSDEHLSIVTYLKSCNVDGAVIVTTPQDVALNDVRKEVTFCRKVGLKMLGIVQNMSTFVCPSCQKESVIFPSTSGGGEALAKETNVPFLGSIPLDPLLARACDEGRNFAEEFKQSPAAIAISSICEKIKVDE
mmetsp:Transcript_22807/g.31292  ORF Transcript_22807/g.31292 Transcript_22807/m.31292 type:complete len:306 (+) Transcript_22807:77-994(+)|eukprot:CAMPEP_0201476414 /NCGR_PEP_ID=MMETSP0151_2-20130828/1615_1 /ASSEMBLY_ACC=CAM_ASM_000257 /TAXON_ID=200890 /ORGANISM="Paramoeba atlantica, Strain 621/1 / CCAP 1560/9" /LENGTH=305 /DNA_ID=CAMNT_0047856763 /DNA_START=74 /DNA_END=991 /DNA_ORIENTATION=-